MPQTRVTEGAEVGWNPELNLERLLYATIVLMSVLVVFDGWGGVTTYLGILLVIVAPTLALVVAHVFSDVLHLQSENRRLLGSREWVAVLHDQMSTASAAVPPLAILAVASAIPGDGLPIVTIIIWSGLATLVGLASFASYRAGLRGWKLLVSAVVGATAGLIVISLQILLKPG